MSWRNAAGVFGVMCSAIVIAIVARHGFMTASTEVDGYITAAFFGMIATGGLAGHALAVRVWRVSRLAAVLIVLAAGSALLANLSNSIGFISGRDDVNDAKRAKIRQQARQDNAALDRLVKAREWLPKFTPATEASVQAAREAVTSAETARMLECKQRGSRCRDREADERMVRDRLVVAESNLALTKSAQELDAKIEAVRSRLQTSEPVAKEYADATALGKLFSIPAGTVASYRQLAQAAVAELLIVVSLVAFELLGRPDREQRKLKPVGRREEEAVPELASEPAPKPASPPAARLGKKPPPPRLISVALETGDILEFTATCLQPADGGSMLIGDLHQAYQEWCQAEGYEALAETDFALKFVGLCSEAGFPCDGRSVQFMCLRAAA